MKLTFLGDVMLDAEQCALHKTGTGVFDFSENFSSLPAVFADSDCIVANLETPVAGEKAGFTHAPYVSIRPWNLRVRSKTAA